MKCASIVHTLIPSSDTHRSRCCTCHGLAPLTCSDSELAFKTFNPLRHFATVP